MPIKNRILPKVKDKRGLTMVEMLVTVVIVVLMSGLISTGTALAARSYTRSMQMSEANQLYGTLKSILTYELQYTPVDSIQIDGDSVIFKSTNYWVHGDAPSEMIIKKQKDTDPAGEIVFALVKDGVVSEDEYNPLLSARTYPNGIGANANIQWLENQGMFQVTLEIYAGQRPLVQQEFTVINMGNKEKKITPEETA